MEMVSICRFGPLIQDGSSYSDTLEHTLQMKEEKYFRWMPNLIKKTDKLLSNTNTMAPYRKLGMLLKMPPLLVIRMQVEMGQAVQI